MPSLSLERFQQRYAQWRYTCARQPFWAVQCCPVPEAVKVNSYYLMQVLRVAVAGSGGGRAKSLRQTADSVTKTMETLQLSSEADPHEVPVSKPSKVTFVWPV